MEIVSDMQVSGKFRSSYYLLQATDFVISFDELNSRIQNVSAHRNSCFSYTFAVLLDEYETEEFSTW
jgi:hypothetical protein